jgi:hypothetical protein
MFKHDNADRSSIPVALTAPAGHIRTRQGCNTYSHTYRQGHDVPVAESIDDLITKGAVELTMLL